METSFNKRGTSKDRLNPLSHGSRVRWANQATVPDRAPPPGFIESMPLMTSRFLNALALAAVPALVAPAAAFAAAGPAADVPASHWAASAVRQMTGSGAMSLDAAGRFNGEAPFTRLALTQVVASLLGTLEARSKTTWSAEGLGGYAFEDLGALSASEKARVLDLANRYRLFEGVPGVTSRTFEPNKQVTRYEMAKVVNRLMRLGEARGAVNAGVLDPTYHAFTDLPESAWPYAEVKAVADRYQVMVGFPDGTFRGPEELTRYQFAATASQTLPLIVDLVDRSTAPVAAPSAAPAEALMPRFLESHPVALLGGVSLSPATAATGALRAAGYFGGDWLVLGEAALSQPAGTTVDGSLNLGYAWRLTPAIALQPYVGAGAAWSGQTLGGVNYGAVLYGRPSESLGLYARARGFSGLGDTAGTASAMGFFAGGGELGLEWLFSKHLGLSVEGGYRQVPTYGGPATTAGAPVLTAPWLPTAQAGLNIRF